MILNMEKLTHGDTSLNKQDLYYLASPYSHIDPAMREARYKLAVSIAGRLMQKGFFIFSPIAHTHPIAEDCNLPKGWDYWGELDSLMLKACNSLILLGSTGWSESFGVREELLFMLQENKPCWFMHIDRPTYQFQRILSVE